MMHEWLREEVSSTQHKVMLGEELKKFCIYDESGKRVSLNMKSGAQLSAIVFF